MLKFLVDRRSWGLRLDGLWLVAVLAGTLFLTSLVPLPPNDFWWHLRIGRIIHEVGQIPATNMFGWAVPHDQAFVYGAWLGEYSFYTLHRWGGLELVIFARTVLLAGALVLVGCEAHRRSHSWRLGALAVLLTFLMSLNNLVVRPQNWSWIPFMLFVLILGAYVDRQIRWPFLLLCPFVMVLWVNLHGAYILGLLLMGTYLCGETLGKLLKVPRQCSWQQIRRLGLATVFTVLAAFANPQGFGSLRYVATLMTDAPSQRLVVEWQSPTPGSVANTVFFVSVLLLMLCFWLSRRAPRPTDVLLTLGFLWMAWNGMRYVVWFGMIAMPIFAAAVADLVRNKRLLVSPIRNYLNLAMAVLLFVPVVLVQPWFVEQSIPLLPEQYQDLVVAASVEGPLLGVGTPVGAARYLAAHPRGPMFNEMGYGSYLIWALPDQPVFVDPRVELYPLEIWEDYRRISHGIRYDSLLAKYGAQRVVLDKEIQGELSISLAEDASWALAYEDERTQIWDSLVP